MINPLTETISAKDVHKMSFAQLKEERRVLDSISLQLCNIMIESGRGMEKPRETRNKDDELSQRINSINDRLRTINIEITSRMG